MTDEDAREKYRASREKLGDVGRVLALAGLGLVWLMAFQLNTPSGETRRLGPNPTNIPKDMLCPAVLFVGSVLLDFLEHGAIAWTLRQHALGKPPRRRTRRVSLDGMLFAAKLAFLLVGFFLLAPAAWDFFVTRR